MLVEMKREKETGQDAPRLRIDCPFAISAVCYILNWIARYLELLQVALTLQVALALQNGSRT